MYIFGGDRHLMAFNDLYCFDLEKGIKSIDLYKNNWANQSIDYSFFIIKIYTQSNKKSVYLCHKPILALSISNYASNY